MCLTTLLDSFVISNSFLVGFLGFSMYKIMLTTNIDNLMSTFFIFGCFFEFLFLAQLSWLRFPEQFEVKVARVGTLVLFLNLEETFNLSPLSMMSAIGLLYMEYILLQYFPSIPDLLRVSNVTWCWILSDDFFYIHWDDYIIFILYSVEVVHHIYWFLYVELSLHPRDKSHLTMVCDPFNVLLNSVC